MVKLDAEEGEAQFGEASVAAVAREDGGMTFAHVKQKRATTVIDLDEVQSDHPLVAWRPVRRVAHTIFWLHRFLMRRKHPLHPPFLMVALLLPPPYEILLLRWPHFQFDF